jgi:hypothetical protein
MALLRRGGRDLAVVVVIVAILAALGLNRAIGSGSERERSREAFSSERYGFSGSLPEGWSRSPKRLVSLLMPREVLSVGTAAMAVGRGGNCGREPVAALARMRAGDGLISIQEYEVTPRMRARIRSTYPPLDSYAVAGQLGLRRQASVHPGRYWSATLPFRDHGRVFDALVYLKGPPSAARLRQVRSILVRLEFEAEAQERSGIPS